MESKLKFGLVGCGSIGKRHAEIINELGILVAVCDTEIVKLSEFTTKYNCKGYESYEVMLQNAGDIQVMVICTPNYLHATQSIMALNAGLHVLCEKPMALKLEDAQLMIQAAKRNNKILWIVKQNRFNPPVAYLKELVEEGKLGKIYSLNIQGLWNRNQEYYVNSNWKGKIKNDGGILFTQFSHFIDAACWIFGRMECKNAIGNNFAHNSIIEFDDTIMGLVEFKNKVHGCFHFSINAYSKNMEGSMTVLGEKGSIAIGGPYLNKLNYHVVEGQEVPELNPENPINDYGYYKGSMNNHSMVYQQFLKSLIVNNISQKDLDVSLQTIEALVQIAKCLNYTI